MQRGSLQVSALHKSTKIRQLCVCLYMCTHIYIYVYMYVYSIVHIHAEYVYNIYIYTIYICTDSMILCVYMNVSKCVRASVLVAWLAKNSPKAMPGASACDFLPPCHWGTIRIIPLLKNVVQTCSNRLTYPRAIKHGNGKRQIYWMIFIDFPCKTPVGVDFPACHVWLTESTIYIPVHWDDSGNHGKTTAFQCCKPICGRL